MGSFECLRRVFMIMVTIYLLRAFPSVRQVVKKPRVSPVAKLCTNKNRQFEGLSDPRDPVKPIAPSTTSFSPGDSLETKDKQTIPGESAPKSSPEIDTVSSRNWLLQFDGGSRGNPGMGGSGAVLYTLDSDSGKPMEIWSKSQFIGKAGVTNNVAEYQGLIEGLKQGVKMNIPSLTIQGDSELILRQIQGIYKVRNDRLKVFHQRAQKLLQKVPQTTFAHIPRAQNARADELSNIAMDQMSSKNNFHKENLDALNLTVDALLAAAKAKAKAKSKTTTSSASSSSSTADANNSSAKKKKSSSTAGNLKRSRVSAKEKAQSRKSTVAVGSSAPSSSSSSSTSRTSGSSTTTADATSTATTGRTAAGGAAATGGKRTRKSRTAAESAVIDPGPGITHKLNILLLIKDRATDTTSVVVVERLRSAEDIDGMIAANQYNSIPFPPVPSIGATVSTAVEGGGTHSAGTVPLLKEATVDTAAAVNVTSSTSSNDSSHFSTSSSSSSSSSTTSPPPPPPPAAAAAAAAATTTTTPASQLLHALEFLTQEMHPSKFAASLNEHYTEYSSDYNHPMDAHSNITDSALYDFLLKNKLQGRLLHRETIWAAPSPPPPPSSLSAESSSSFSSEAASLQTPPAPTVWSIGQQAPVSQHQTNHEQVSKANDATNSSNVTSAAAAVGGDPTAVHVENINTSIPTVAVTGSDVATVLGGNCSAPAPPAISSNDTTSFSTADTSAIKSTTTKTTATTTTTSNMNLTSAHNGSSVVNDNSNMNNSSSGDICSDTVGDSSTQNYMFADRWSSVTTYVVEVENPTKALKSIDKINEKALQQQLIRNQQLATAGTDGSARKRRSTLRSVSKNLLVNRGLVKLTPVPLDYLVRYLQEQSYLDGKVIDQFLFSWALGYTYGQLFANTGIINDAASAPVPHAVVPVEDTTVTAQPQQQQHNVSEPAGNPEK